MPRWWEYFWSVFPTEATFGENKFIIYSSKYDSSAQPRQLLALSSRGHYQADHYGNHIYIHRQVWGLIKMHTSSYSLLLTGSSGRCQNVSWKFESCESLRKDFSYKDSISHSSDQSNFKRNSQTDLLWAKWQRHDQTGSREFHLLQLLLKLVAALLSVEKGLSFCWKLVFLAMPSIINLLKKQEQFWI